MTPDILTFFRLATERIDANGGTVPPELWEAVSGEPMCSKPAAPKKAKQNLPKKSLEDKRKEMANKLIRKHLFGQEI